MRAIVIVIAALFIGGVTFVYFSPEHTERVEYQDSRERWHHDCDAYLGKPVVSEDAKDCAKRLEAMMAYSKQHGW